MATTEFDGTPAATEPASFEKVSVGRQVLRRELNDRISARNGDAVVEVFCECGRAGCRDAVRLERVVYESLRRVPTHFLIRRSHADPSERVVETVGDFLVVEKFGPSGLEAIKLDRDKQRLPSERS